MSEENKNKSNKRFLGKIRAVQGQYGTFYQILLDNINNVNKDGTPNKYYKGALIWGDLETGKNYQVKQLSLVVPKDGFKESEIKNGVTHFISIDLDDEYQVDDLNK